MVFVLGGDHIPASTLESACWPSLFDNRGLVFSVLDLRERAWN
jgi:hypothetical protein